MRSFSVRPIALALLVALVALAGCKRSGPSAVIAHGDTFAEMRTIKGEVSVTTPTEAKRAPSRAARRGVRGHARRRRARVDRRDAGAVWLVECPAQLTVREEAVKLTSGRAFVDAEDGPPVRTTRRERRARSSQTSGAPAGPR